IPLTASGLAGVPAGDAGAASGLVNVAHQLGGSVGLGVLVSVFAAAGHAHTRHLASISQNANDLAHAISMPLTASVVFLALALAVVLLVMRRPPRAAEVARIPENRLAEAREAA
ncbi:MAG TPA: hypothetical protein VNY33_03595, partial [Gaiellaceae bacterium]|nr:hypothetical protein [Gaiellaceae bacterium]